MTVRDILKRIPWGLTITTLIALAILIGLGVWQLQRRERELPIQPQH